MIKLLDSLHMQTGLPIDDRIVVKTSTNRDEIEKAVRYIGLEVYVSDEKKKYRLEDGIENIHWKEIRSVAKASELITDDNHMTVTKAEKEKWNSMSSATEHTHNATDIVQDETHKFVSDTQIANWNSKADGNHNHNDLYATKTHIHQASEITGLPQLPESLKNPYALYISVNGTQKGKYDGSSVTNINVAATDLNVYNKGEVDAKLAEKAPSQHQHPTWYYTKNEIDTKLSSKANTSHAHNTLKIINGSKSITYDGTSAKEITIEAGGGVPVTHTHSSENIVNLNGYIKHNYGGSLNTTDTLNLALGKLEKNIENKADVSHSHSGYAHSNHTHSSDSITALIGYRKEHYYGALSSSDNLNQALSKIENNIDDKASLNHNHSEYVTQNYVTTWLAEYVPKNGSSTISGSLTVTGEILSNNNVTAYSDRTLKENLIELDDSVIEKLKQLKFYNYNMISDETKRKRVGVIAQELEELFPELVFEDENGIKSVDYIGLNTYFSFAIQQKLFGL